MPTGPPLTQKTEQSQLRLGQGSTRQIRRVLLLAVAGEEREGGRSGNSEIRGPHRLA